MIRASLPAVLAFALAACTPPGEEEETPAHRHMTDVIDPAAGVIWGSAGVIITAEGVEDLTPDTPEEWASVRASARAIVDGAATLVVDGMVPAGGDPEAWGEFSEGMARIAGQVADAVDRQDGDALFTLGGYLYNVCVACHQVYARPEA